MKDDTIYRQAAINELEREAACGDRDCEKGLLYAVDVLELFPSAQPERKKGRWIAHVGGKFVGFPYMHYECDQCRAFEPTETNYCPNCGADMRGEE